MIRRVSKERSMRCINGFAVVEMTNFSNNFILCFFTTSLCILQCIHDILNANKNITVEGNKGSNLMRDF